MKWLMGTAAGRVAVAVATAGLGSAVDQGLIDGQIGALLLGVLRLVAAPFGS